MRIKIFLGVVLLLAGCLTPSINAARIKEKKEKNQSILASTYSRLNCKKGPISFVRSHPFITALFVVAILSSKMRSILINLPQRLWYDIQTYPIAMALIIGFTLSYVVI